MPTASIPNFALPDIASIVPAKGVEVGTAESFLALLNAGGGGKPSISHGDDREDDRRLPPAAPIDIPQPALRAVPGTRQADAEEVIKPADNKPVEIVLAPAPAHPAQKPAVQKTTAPAQDDDTAVSDAALPADTPADDNQPVGDNVAQGIAKFRLRLQEQLSDISQLLQSIIQALAGAAQTADGTAVPTTNETPSPELAVLTDIQSILEQLQQILPGQTIPAQGALPPGQLQALLGQLQKDIIQLSQLLQADTGSDTPVLPDFSALGAELKQHISEIRSQLQQIKSDNEDLLAQMQQTLPQDNIGARLAQAVPTLKDMLARHGLVLQDSVVNDTAAPEETTASTKPLMVAPKFADITSGAAATQNNAPATGPATLQPTVSFTASSNTGTNMGGGNNSNPGQGQPMAQPLTAVSAAQTPAGTGNVNMLSFARLLDSPPAARPVLEQISFQIKTATNDGSSKIHIQLDPAELGKLTIQLNVGADGKTGVSITADSKQTLTLLQQDAHGLARALTDAGLSTDSGSLNFNLSGGQQEAGDGTPGQAAQTYQNSQPEDEIAAIDVLTRSYLVNLAEGLDIKI